MAIAANPNAVRMAQFLLNSPRSPAAALQRSKKRMQSARYCGVSFQVPMAALAMSARLVAISMYSTLAQRSANER